LYVYIWRSDHGLENVGVADFMFAAREQEGVHSYTLLHSISVINLINFFCKTSLKLILSIWFRNLEQQGLLNPSVNEDIFILHTVAQQLLETTASGFKDGWNCHPLSTENNFTPAQLFRIGLLQLRSKDGFHHELIQVILT